jgi:hypothetical protein
MNHKSRRNTWIAPQLRALSAGRAAAGFNNWFATEGGHLVESGFGRPASENVLSTFGNDAKGLATTGAAPS